MTLPVAAHPQSLPPSQMCLRLSPGFGLHTTSYHSEAKEAAFGHCSCHLTGLREPHGLLHCPTPTMKPDAVSFPGHSHNMVPQSGWLQTTQTYPLTVPEARGLESRCQRSHAPSGGSREEFFTVSSCWWLLAILGIPWLHHPSFCLCLHMILSSVCVCVPSFSYKASP